MIAPMAEAHHEGSLWLPVGSTGDDPEAYLYEDGSTWARGVGWKPAMYDDTPSGLLEMVTHNEKCAERASKRLSLDDLRALLAK